jgi:hypothetical protein
MGSNATGAANRHNGWGEVRIRSSAPFSQPCIDFNSAALSLQNRMSSGDGTNLTLSYVSSCLSVAPLPIKPEKIHGC